ncbi:MAG: hypothetical protein EBS89_08710, partial [Proteobacteria bacterium]|nr:hypothetical protein [Pseudomonadota bacterium]
GADLETATMAKKFYLGSAKPIFGIAGVEFTVQEGGVFIRTLAADATLQPTFDKEGDKLERLEDARALWTELVRVGFVRVPAL